MPKTPDLTPLLQRVADALERLAPAAPDTASLSSADAFIWRAEQDGLEAVRDVNRVDYGLLKGIERQAGILLVNTQRFAASLPANNALLWGARGMGKSSLVKAVHARVNREAKAKGKSTGRLVLVEIHREDIPSLPRLLHILRGAKRRCILFCDDLSFDGADTSYKSLKGVASRAGRRMSSFMPPRTAAT